MSDLISRSALLKSIREVSTSPLNEWDTLGVLKIVNEQPSVTDTNVGGKWHYLDKNPDDLPKHNGWYIICHGTEWTNGKLTHNSKKNYDSEIRMCEFFDGKWQKLGMVIAWCEKPEHPYKGE